LCGVDKVQQRQKHLTVFCQSLCKRLCIGSP
jgi:hypothetical protein